ncbi:hypothetical protein QAD02_013575 [Eretmocerus hayati]|uniref:Uncharacterized protein n=1 Tax=Eretmocerus hayati TaxID=131215 RepID=A0ACC2P3V3_9HYME|nr:hypothetical protein QAD02_013575 [Eretmocerus hayati]
MFVQPNAPPVVNQPTGTLPKRGRKPKRVVYPDEPRNTRSNAHANKDAGTDSLSRASSSNSIAFTLGPDDLNLLHRDNGQDDDSQARKVEREQFLREQVRMNEQRQREWDIEQQTQQAERVRIQNLEQRRIIENEVTPLDERINVLVSQVQALNADFGNRLNVVENDAIMASRETETLQTAQNKVSGRIRQLTTANEHLLTTSQNLNTIQNTLEQRVATETARLDKDIRRIHKVNRVSGAADKLRTVDELVESISSEVEKADSICTETEDCLHDPSELELVHSADGCLTPDNSGELGSVEGSDLVISELICLKNGCLTPDNSKLNFWRDLVVMPESDLASRFRALELAEDDRWQQTVCLRLVWEEVDARMEKRCRMAKERAKVAMNIAKNTIHDVAVLENRERSRARDMIRLIDRIRTLEGQLTRLRRRFNRYPLRWNHEYMNWARHPRRLR